MKKEIKVKIIEIIGDFQYDKEFDKAVNQILALFPVYAKEIVEREFSDVFHDEFCAKKGSQFKECGRCRIDNLLTKLNL